MRFPLLLSTIGLLTLTACVPPDGTQPNGRTAVPGAPEDIVVNEDLPAGNFGSTDAGFSGELIVRGFARIEQTREPFCTRNCAMFDYVFFHVTETGNAALADYLRQMEGNAYVSGNGIGLGCVEDDVIRYTNASDAQGMREFTLSPEVAQRILASNAETPVTLGLLKRPLTGGSEAPACYSHFSSISLRNS